MSRHDRRRPGWPASLLAMLAMTVAAGCGRSGARQPSTAPTTAPAATTVPTTAPPPSTTTTALPSALQPSAEDAAAQLVDGWSTGNRPLALTVARASAVATLFAVPYPSGNAVPRGCSDQEFVPVVCSYGPPGGGSGTLFEINVSPSGSNWYVSSVDVDTES